MTYVVHGATGAQGGPVLAALTAAGAAVTALTRRSDADVPGAKLHTADLDDHAALTAAYRDADGVFVHLPVVDPPLRQRYLETIAAALHQARPRRVVYSTSGRDAATDPMAAALRASALPHTVIAPRYYLENLLLPVLQDGVRDDGVLRYPLPAGFAASWCSHLDVADAATALLTGTDAPELVEVGQHPGATGADLAAAFADAYGRDVAYEPIAPAAFATLIAPAFGTEAAAAVAASYEHAAAAGSNTIDPAHSAQRLLGLVPRTPAAWAGALGRPRH